MRTWKKHRVVVKLPSISMKLFSFATLSDQICSRLHAVGSPFQSARIKQHYGASQLFESTPFPRPARIQRISAKHPKRPKLCLLLVCALSSKIELKNIGARAALSALVSLLLIDTQKYIYEMRFSLACLSNFFNFPSIGNVNSAKLHKLLQTNFQKRIWEHVHSYSDNDAFNRLSLLYKTVNPV